MKTNILVVVVLYGETLERSVSFRTISQQCANYNNGKTIIYVHDNSFERDEYAATRTDIIYFHTPENKGLGYAYNRAAEWAVIHKFEWILLLDQDTILPDDLLVSYCNAISHNPKIHLFVPCIQLSESTMLSPGRIWRSSVVLPKDRTYSLHRAMIINSGIFIKTTFFIAAGGYNEKVWLDFSDTQFIRKLSQLEAEYYLTSSVCVQNFSDKEEDINKLKKRFRIYLQCARECQYFNIEDFLYRRWCVFHHTMALTIKKRSLCFFEIFINDYIL